HGFGARATTRRRIEPGTVVEAGHCLSERLVEVRKHAVHVEPHADAHAAVISVSSAVVARSIGRTAIAATMATSIRLAGARRPASQMLCTAIPASPAQAPIRK